jgi:hypothetical protein
VLQRGSVTFTRSGTSHLRAAANLALSVVLAAIGCSDDTASNAPSAPQAGQPAAAAELPAAGAQSEPPPRLDPAQRAPAADASQPADAGSPAADGGGPTAPPPSASGLDAAMAAPAQDAGPLKLPAEPTCDDYEWRLAAGFLPALHVDYIADRDQGIDAPRVFSSVGVACATAKDRPACEASLALQPDLLRHLVTTQGDDVRMYTTRAATELLGAIDTPAEALWMLLGQGYAATCEVTFQNRQDGILVQGTSPSPFCQIGPNFEDRLQPEGDVLVAPDGSISYPSLPPGHFVTCNTFI